MTEFSSEIKIKEIKPALSGYISKSLVLLKQKQVPDDDAVHDIRVLMKKSRAVLKLIQPQIKSELYDKDFQSLKQVGKILSRWRDVNVHRKTMRELKRKWPSIFIQLENNERIRFLLSRQESAFDQDESTAESLKEIEILLRKTGYRIRFNQLKELDVQLLTDQLSKSYEVVQKVYLECRNKTTPVRIHRLRKRSKDFLYQLWFFRLVKSSKVKVAEKTLEKLTRNLCRYNDLHQLLTELEYVYPNDGKSPAMDDLVIKIRGLQDKYLQRAWPDAYKCFSPYKGLSPSTLGLYMQTLQSEPLIQKNQL